MRNKKKVDTEELISIEEARKLADVENENIDLIMREAGTAIKEAASNGFYFISYRLKEGSYSSLEAKYGNIEEKLPKVVKKLEEMGYKCDWGGYYYINIEW